MTCAAWSAGFKAWRCPARRQAMAFKADLLLMSTHGRSGVSRLLFGSVAQNVTARYRGAVLLLRPELAGRKSA